MNELLKNLCLFPKNEKVIIEQLKNHFPPSEIKTDNSGNIIAGKGNVILTAHRDRIGFIVNYIDKDKDFILLTPLGGLDGRILPAQIVDIYSGENVIKGVLTAMPPHLQKGKDRPNTQTIWCDVTGAEKNQINLGDIAYFKPNWAELLNDRVSGTGLDNAVGVAAVFEVLRNLKEKQLENIKVIFTVEEELGERGAKISFYNELSEPKNTKAIVFDATFGTDPHNDKTETFDLGKGAAIGVSPSLNNTGRNAIRVPAEWQTEVMNGRTGTDADIISTTRGGIETYLISIPLRNMHTPTEVVDIGDIKSASKYAVKEIIR